MKKISLAAIALAPILMLTACGGSDDEAAKSKNVEKISLEDLSQEDVDAYVEEARTNLKEIETMKLAGKLDEMGAMGAGTMEIQANLNGECNGTITTDAGELSIVSDGDQAFMKAGKEFWLESTGAEAGNAEAEAAVSQIADKWVLNDGLDEMCDLQQFTEVSDEDKELKVKAVAVEDINGEQAVKITSEGADGSTVGWVSVSEPHYIVQVETDEGQLIQFSDFNEEFEVEMPAEGEYVDLSNL